MGVLFLAAGAVLLLFAVAFWRGTTAGVLRALAS